MLPRILYLLVFSGGYLLFTKGLRFKKSRTAAVAVLTLGLFLLYLNSSRGLAATLVRYLLFAAVYSAWGVCFLAVDVRYALYLGSFFTILMGVWISCVQVVLSFLGISSPVAVVLWTGLCRLISILVIRRFLIRVDAGRSISVQEMVLSLFPAMALFLANLVLYEYIGLSDRFVPAWRFPVALLVLFFGFSALAVLIHSESYFELSRLKREGELARSQLAAQYQLFMQEKESTERVMAMRHDILNHLHTIEQMAGGREAGLIRDYASELQEQDREAQSAFLTGNATLDALLLAKAPGLREKGIRLTCFLSMKGAEFLTPMEVCTLFANALDNAAEAVSSPAVSEKEIRLSGAVANGSLVVKIENGYAHDLLPDQGRFRSTKERDGTHGYGMRNMERIIDRYDGTMTCKARDGVFTLIWMIPLPEAQDKK